jgi:hypothetical protein
MKNINIAIMKEVESYGDAEALKTLVEDALKDIPGITFQYSYNDDLKEGE